MVFTSERFPLLRPPGWTLQLKKTNGSYVLDGLTQAQKEDIERDLINQKILEIFHDREFIVDNEFLRNRGYDIEVWFRNGSVFERGFNINEIILLNIYHHVTSPYPQLHDPHFQNLHRLWKPNFEWPDYW